MCIPYDLLHSQVGPQPLFAEFTSRTATRQQCDPLDCCSNIRKFAWTTDHQAAICQYLDAGERPRTRYAATPARWGSPPPQGDRSLWHVIAPTCMCDTIRGLHLSGTWSLSLASTICIVLVVNGSVAFLGVLCRSRDLPSLTGFTQRIKMSTQCGGAAVQVGSSHRTFSKLKN
jgi:hypothetical protein